MRVAKPALAFGAAAALFISASGVAWAAGFALRDGSPDWVGTASAGNAAKTYDAATAWTNPAGMSRLNRSELDVSASYIDPYTRFYGLDENAAAMVSGAHRGTDPSVVGSLFATWKATPALSFGIAATTPYAARLSYPDGWAGRYQSLATNLTDYAVLVSASYQITDRFSIGGGPVVDYFSGHLAQAVDLGIASALAGDARDSFSGDDVGLGFDAGALFQATDTLRIGANYRSEITHDLQGKQDVVVPEQLTLLNPAATRQLNVLNGRARSRITLPDTADLSTVWQVSPDLALLATLEWTHWGLFNNLTVVPANLAVPTTTRTENWRNTWFGSIGANLRVSNTVTLQTGLGYDQTPVRNAQTRTAGFPDVDRIVLGAGVSWSVLQDVDLLVGYNHLFGLAAPIDSANGRDGRLSGSMHLGADVVSIGARARF